MDVKGDLSIPVMVAGGAIGALLTLTPEGYLIGGAISAVVFELARAYIPWKRVPFLKF